MNYETYNGSGTWDILAHSDFPYDHYVHKTLTRLPRIGIYNKYAPWGNGVVNRVGLDNKGLAHFEEEIAPRIAVDFVASIYATHEWEWGFLAERLDAFDSVEALEANFSCPNIDDSALDVVGMQQAIETVRNKTDKPVYVKLGPHQNVYDALTCQNAGASKLVLCNSLPTPKGGLSGAPVRSLVLDLIAKLTDTETFEIPIIGMGGINGLDDDEGISEFLAAGATDIGIGCANLTL